MGRILTVQATATMSDGRPAADCLLLPYVNGRRWGSHEFANAHGEATFALPLPNPGKARIQLEARPGYEQWIWATHVLTNQTIYLQATFQNPGQVGPAPLWVQADDQADVYLNGKCALTNVGKGPARPVDVSALLRAGQNVLLIQATKANSVAGVLVRLDLATRGGVEHIFSGKDWRWCDTKPAGWPTDQNRGGEKVILLGPPDNEPLTAPGWPTKLERAAFMDGYPLPAAGSFSDALQVQVDWRPLQSPPKDPDHLIAMHYALWFTPNNPITCWNNAQAVPLVGCYWGDNPDVIRQHLIWLIESGVDVLSLGDWVGFAFGLQHWSERNENTQRLIRNSTLLLDTLIALRDEGHQVPKVMLLVGKSNGDSALMSVVNEELDWIQETYLNNPRYRSLFQGYLGKPLVILFNGDRNSPPTNSNYTYRYMSAFLNLWLPNEANWWSWWDGSLEPVAAHYQGEVEALTVTPATFPKWSWLEPGAYGRMGGWTYLETYKTALKTRPRFLIINQFQEFAGQFEGAPYQNGAYADSYNAELSTDIEPVSLNTPGYRSQGDGGWGFQMLNLTRALNDLYRQPNPETTVLAVARPLRGQVVHENELEVRWNWVGKPPTGFALALNGRTVANHLQGKETTLHLKHLKDGPCRLRLTAMGTQARYQISLNTDSLPADKMEPADSEVEFILQREMSRPGNTGDGK